jgi:beta-lactamase class A
VPLAGRLDPETEQLLRRWRESERRSRERRSPPPRRRPALLWILAALATVLGGLTIQASQSTGESQGLSVARVSAAHAGVPEAPLPARAPTLARASARPGAERSPGRIPSAAALHDAWGFARDRIGVVSLAVVNSEGQLRGRKENRRFASASVVKAMLLAAEIRRLKKAGAGIDSTTDSLLTAMITWSDNEAADAIYSRVGDAGLFAVAKRVGMTRFTVAGYWGNAQITAADMARFFGDLDQALARRHREYAQGLLGSIIESQRWGIPQAAGNDWAVRFKGGWLPDHALVHQAAELQERDGNRELSIAVLTDLEPSHEYGVETVRGVAERLLRENGGGASSCGGSGC